MKTKKTQRGFSYTNFKDRNGRACSIQRSSVADDEGVIWFGCDDIGRKKFTPNKIEGGGKWEDVPTPSGGCIHGEISYIANTRMHLNQSQVKELLPILQHFAETGELPE
jgi:hypothetical protein